MLFCQPLHRWQIDCERAEQSRYLVLHPSAAARTPEETPSHPAHSPGRRFSRWPGLNGPQSPRETRLLPCTYSRGWGAQPWEPSAPKPLNDLNLTSTVSLSQPECSVLFWPFSSLQVIVGLFKLSDVFVELLLDAASLSQVVLQHRNLFVALGVLLLQLLLNQWRREKSSGVSEWRETRIPNRPHVPGKNPFPFPEFCSVKNHLMDHTIVSNSSTTTWCIMRELLFHFHRASLFPGEALRLIYHAVLHSTVSGGAAWLHCGPWGTKTGSMIHDRSGSLTQFVFSISCCEHSHMLGHVKNHNTVLLWWLTLFRQSFLKLEAKCLKLTGWLEEGHFLPSSSTCVSTWENKQPCVHLSMDFWVYEVHINAPWSPEASRLWVKTRRSRDSQQKSDYMTALVRFARFTCQAEKSAQHLVPARCYWIITLLPFMPAVIKSQTCHCLFSPSLSWHPLKECWRIT